MPQMVGSSPYVNLLYSIISPNMSVVSEILKSLPTLECISPFVVFSRIRLVTSSSRIVFQYCKCCLFIVNQLGYK